MKLHRPQSYRVFLATSRLMALFFLWMGLGGVLLHEDDFVVVRASSAPTSWQPFLSAPADHDCVACEWTQGLQIGSSVVLQVVTTTVSFAFLSFLFIPFVTRPLIGLSSPRAPPVF
jgi:hypothetical protein